MKSDKKKNLPKHILFTGGHHNSAVAVIDELRATKSFEFSWVGKKYINDTTKELLPEYKEVTNRGVQYYKIKTGKLYRARSFRYLPQIIYNLLLIPVGFIQAFFILRKDKPDIIASFGGYIAVPVVLVGKFIFNIPILMHEQTAVLGVANAITAKYADTICVSWPIDNYKVPFQILSKMIYTGLPLRKEILKLLKFPQNHNKLFGNNNKLPTIYVTGGKSGALFLNKLIYEIFDDLIKGFNIIWQCGPSNIDYNYSFLRSFIDAKDKSIKDRVILKKYFSEEEIGNVFKTADIVLSRGGAHTIYELAVLKKPSVIVPIPWASNNEQYKNSIILKSAGIAEVLDQNNLKSNDLLKVLIDMFNDLGKYQLNENAKFPLNGSKLVSNEIIKLIKT